MTIAIMELLKKAENYRMIKFCYPSEKVKTIAIVNIQNPFNESIMTSIFVDKLRPNIDKLARLRYAIVNSDKCNDILKQLKEQIDEYETMND